MNITIATPYLPHPAVAHGGGQDLYHLVRFLSRRHEIRLACLADPADRSAADALRPYVSELCIVPAAFSRRERWEAFCSARWNEFPIFSTRALGLAISKWPAEVLQCCWTEMGPFLRYASPLCVRVLDEVDVRFIVEEAVEEASAANRFRVGLRKRRELTSCRSADLVLTRSQRDLCSLKAEIPGLRGLAQPPVAHVAEYLSIQPESSIPGRVLFMGAMYRWRNQLAVEWFAKNVWPAVVQRHPQTQFRIVGANPPERIAALTRLPGVLVTGHVDNLESEYAKARIVVAPMRSEAGCLNKILDGMAAGRAVVATTIANRGVNAPPEAITLANGASEFADGVVRLLADHREWQRQSEAGRRYVKQAFVWEKAVQIYEETLLSIRDEKLAAHKSSPLAAAVRG